MASVEAVLSVGSGITLALVGALLVALRPRRPGALGFALFTLTWGLALTSFNLPALAPDLVRWTFPLGLALLFPLPLFTLHFATRFPGGGTPTTHAATLGLGGLLFLVAAAFALAPHRFISEVPLALGTGAALDFTLLATLVGVVPVFASLFVAVALMARTFRHSESATHRTELAVVLGALGLYLAFTTPYFLVALGSSLRGGDPRILAQFAMFCGGAAALGLVAWHLRRTTDVRARKVEAFFYGGAALGILAALLFLWGGRPFAAHGSVRVLVAVVIAYGILKHQVFDLDLKLKTGLRGVTPAALFAAAYFLAAEFTEGLLADATGSSLVALGAAAGFVILEERLLRLGLRVAQRVLPGVEPTPSYLDRRREVVYRAALETAAADGLLTTRERRMLAAIRRELGLPDGDARRLEVEVFGVEPPTPTP